MQGGYPYPYEGPIAFALVAVTALLMYAILRLAQAEDQKREARDVTFLLTMLLTIVVLLTMESWTQILKVSPTAGTLAVALGISLALNFFMRGIIRRKG